MTSNSAVVTDGITAALLPLLDVTIGTIRRVEDVLTRRLIGDIGTIALGN